MSRARPTEPRRTLLPALLLLGALGWELPTHAATITVDSNADTTVAGDDACTLREAIINANHNSDDGSSLDQLVRG